MGSPRPPPACASSTTSAASCSTRPPPPRRRSSGRRVAFTPLGSRSATGPAWRSRAGSASRCSAPTGPGPRRRPRRPTRPRPRWGRERSVCNGAPGRGGIHASTSVSRATRLRATGIGKSVAGGDGGEATSKPRSAGLPRSSVPAGMGPKCVCGRHTSGPFPSRVCRVSGVQRVEGLPSTLGSYKDGTRRVAAPPPPLPARETCGGGAGGHLDPSRDCLA